MLGLIDTLSGGAWTAARVSVPTAAPLGGNVGTLEAPTGTNSCVRCLIQGIATRNPVNTENGNFFHTFSDITILGRSNPLGIARTYSSLSSATNGPFGYGWQFNYAMALALSGTSPNQVATITQEDGGQVTFKQPPSGSNWSPSAPRFIATLTANADGTWTFVRQAKDTYTFDLTGHLTRMTDLNGYSTTLGYTSGSLTSITDPAGRTLSLGWTGTHVTSVTDANISPNRNLTYQYNDGNGNLTDVTDINLGVTHFTYDTSHRITVMKAPVCQALGGNCPGVQNHYDAAGRVDWQKDQLNRQTSFAYAGGAGSNAGGTTTTTDPTGNVTFETYQYGVRTSVVRGYGTTAAAETDFSYDAATLVPTIITDPNGNVTSQTVDASGNVLTSADPLNRKISKTYNSLNEALTVQDGNGVTTTNTYDSKGNLTSTSTPLVGSSPAVSQVYTYHHDNATSPGDLTSMTDPDNNTWQYGYDSNGYRASATDPVLNQSTSTYNSVGWKLTDVTPKGNVAGCGCAATYTTTYGYIIPSSGRTNEFGDVQTVTDPLGHVTTSAYDANRNRTSVTDGDGNVTSYVYDVANQLTQTKRADTPQTTLLNDYNPDGTLLDKKDGKGNAIQTFGYDAAARVITVTDALNNTTTYSRDGNGNQLSKQDPGGNCSTSPTSGCTSRTYDGDNELKTETFSDGLTPNVTSVAYDSDGQRTGMTDGTGTSSWTYDSLHRLTSYKNGSGATSSYDYLTPSGAQDLKNQIGHIVYPNSAGTVTRGYDADGHLSSVKDWNGKTTTFLYDPNSNVTTQSVPSVPTVTDTYSYNAADQMTSTLDSNGSTLFSAAYSRDGNGQLSSDSSVPTAVGSYRYTTLNELCYAGSQNGLSCSSPPAGATAYGYDAADNLTANNGRTQQFNAADELCWTVAGSSTNACGSAPTGATTYIYDARGNRTSALSSQGTCNSYDQANRLTQIMTGKGVTCAKPSAVVGTYSYDGNGLRMSKVVGNNTTRFAWDETSALPMLLQEVTGSTSTNYIYGVGGAPLEQISGSTTYWLHHDQQGSTRLITGTSGTSVATFTFDSYGNVTASTGSVTSPLMFTGQYKDAESSLYYLRARYYDPGTGQFISRDPAVATTREPYAYVGDNPLNGTDPSGLCSLNPFAGDSCAKAALHIVLDVVTVAPYAAYYGAYNVIHAVNQFGDRFGPAGTVVSRIIDSPLLIPEAAGLAGDVGIDWVKGHTVNNESTCDEGKRGYINPLHDYVPGPLKGPQVYLPGVHSNGHFDWEW
jgi:RHS repeat-associated protein